MGRRDNYDEVASALLLTDAELGLTFARVAFSYPDGPRRSLVIQRAETAYQQIRKLCRLIQMTDADRVQLQEKLEKLRAALAEAGNARPTPPSAC